MIRVIIGHRGVGKSSLLNRLESLSQSKSEPVQFFDLDKIISMMESQSLREIIKLKGEEKFREIELRYFNEIVRKQRDWPHLSLISVGAGFIGPFDDDLEVIWLQRASDKDGRVFFDRPGLTHEKATLEDFFSRYEGRQRMYKEASHMTYMMEENVTDIQPFEKFMLSQPVSLNERSYLTVHSENLEDPYFFERRKPWGVKFEFRDDLLDPLQIEMGLSKSKGSSLLSLRKPESSEDKLKSFCDIPKDWALELGPPPSVAFFSLSLHHWEKNQSWKALLKEAEDNRPKCYIKFSPLVRDFEDLKAYHQWWIEKPDRRVFLPRSADGRWQWYRLHFGGQMAFQFLRESQEKYLDQPTINLGFSQGNLNIKQFGAVVGDPVHFSWSPEEHRTFFKDRNMGFYKIKMTKQEMNIENLEFLYKLGLRFAAVTSPLKVQVAQIVNLLSQSDWPAVNTAFFKGPKSIIPAETDSHGLKEVLKKMNLPQDDWIVWGGGGMLPALKSSMPWVQFYSIRTGQPRDGSNEIKNPKVIVWAAGKGDHDLALDPPDHWSPKIVIDLSYLESSPAKDWALRKNCNYVSGESLFKEQARAQREFLSSQWDSENRY